MDVTADTIGREWLSRAVSMIEADQRRSADSHLVKLDLPRLVGLDIYLKDESTHPTGSLKHRLARSLFLYGLCNGDIRQGRPVVEASSGSTAVSEAYFARLIGVPFHAVVPRNTSCEKIAAIEHQGGHCHLVDEAAQIHHAALTLAKRLGGHYLDQFTFAERATDWRGNNNIADSMFDQMRHEPHPVPAWIVMSAGTGGTTATIGRYIRYRRFSTRVLVPDPEHSAFFDSYRTRDAGVCCPVSSRIEGIGRPRAEPSFLPGIIDRMLKVPDAASIAAMRVLSRRLGRRVGGSTGTNFVGLCWIAAEMLRAGQSGSLVTLICDAGDRYVRSYYDDTWLAAAKLDVAPFEAALERFLQDAELELSLAQAAHVCGNRDAARMPPVQNRPMDFQLAINDLAATAEER